MAPGEEKPQEPIFEIISKNDLSGMRLLLSEDASLVHTQDEHGMTLLQHAAYKGNKEMVQLLLDQGGDVNSGNHEYGYTALHFAALSGNVEICQILLNSGAKVGATNSVGRTPSQMAAFVGNHACVAIINNFVPKSDIEYFTVPNGLETEPKLPVHLAEPFFIFISEVNLHPVRIAMNLLKYHQLCDHLVMIHEVLEALCKKEMTWLTFNEIMSFKYHYMWCIVTEIARCKKQLEGKERTEGEGDGEGKGKCVEAGESFIKRMLKPNKAGEQELQDIFLRDCVRSYPHRASTLFRQMVTSLVKGECGHALQVIVAAVNGQRGFADADVLSCCTCGQEGATKKCSKCKAVQYCDRECQRLHWFLHKKHCVRDGPAQPPAGPHHLEADKREAIAATTEALKSQLRLS